MIGMIPESRSPSTRNRDRHAPEYAGKRKGKRGRPPAGDLKKAAVVGIAQRKTEDVKGKVIARVSREGVKREVLHGMVKEYVLPKSVVYTDELSAYNGIEALNGENGTPKGYQHRRINHSEGVYVMGDIHTNTIEGFWSLVKRGIGGTHHAVSAKFLQSYLDEYAFRYNRRDVPKPMFKLILGQVSERTEWISPASEERGSQS